MKKTFLSLALGGLLMLLPMMASAYDDPFQEEAQRFDAQTHRNLCGAGDEKVIRSGADYARVKSVADKLNCNCAVYLVREDAFNACASTSEIFVFSGILAQDRDDNHLAQVIAHEMAHVKLGHIRSMYEEKLDLYKQVQRAAQAVNKPGYEENARLVQKMGSPLVDLFSLRYSRAMESEADAKGIAAVAASGFDAYDALGLYDQIPSGAGGILATLSDHPDSQKRKVLLTAVLDQETRITTRATATASYLRKAVTSFDSPELAQAAGGHFDGFAYGFLTDDRNVVALVKGGAGEIKLRTTGRKRSKISAVLLPKETREVILLFINPRPDRYVDVGRLELLPVSVDTLYLPPRCPLLAAKYIAITLPVEPLLTAEAVTIKVFYGDGSDAASLVDGKIKLDYNRLSSNVVQRAFILQP